MRENGRESWRVLVNSTLQCHFKMRTSMALIMIAGEKELALQLTGCLLVAISITIFQFWKVSMTKREAFDVTLSKIFMRKLHLRFCFYVTHFFRLSLLFYLSQTICLSIFLILSLSLCVRHSFSVTLANTISLSHFPKLSISVIISISSSLYQSLFHSLHIAVSVSWSLLFYL